MRIFSRLARRIMHEAFRHALVTADSSEAIAGYCSAAGAVSSSGGTAPGRKLA